MSIILKGIDLPTEDQVIVIHSDGTFNEVDPFARRLMPFYEAIQIPKGHGRLIDVSRLYPTTLEKLEYGGSDGRAVYRRKFQAYTEKTIELAPTILEAEGEDVHKSNV